MYPYRTENLSPDFLAKRNRKARDGARDLLSNYLPLVKSKDRVRELVEQDHELSSGQYWELQGYIRATSTKIVTIHQQAEAAEGGVDWPEEHVIHAIRTLTALDEDQGKYNNKVGWNPRITAIAAAGAAWIALASRNVVMHEKGMLHLSMPRVACDLSSATELRRQADKLDRIAECAAETIAQQRQRRGHDFDEYYVLDLMLEEAWLSATEAFKLGLIDDILYDAEVAA